MSLCLSIISAVNYACVWFGYLKLSVVGLQVATTVSRRFWSKPVYEAVLLMSSSSLCSSVSCFQDQSLRVMSSLVMPSTLRL